MKNQKIVRYSLSVNRTFPAYHPRKGEPTYFAEKILTSLFPKDTFFPVECEKCGFKSWSHMAEGGEQIADTGDYADIYCPKCGSVDLMDIAEDGLVYYRQNESVWPKPHTIRRNYKLWEKRMKKVQDGKAVIDIYYWEKPGGRFADGNRKIVFATLDKDSGCGVQKIDSFMWQYAYVKSNEKIELIEIETLSKNDGLTLEDFKAWFKGYDLSEPMAIIHFTKFRY